MTPDERDAGLTAYALGDPGLTPVERAEIEQRIVNDPAARRAVEEAREVAKLLTAGFARELAAAQPPAVTVPAAAAKPRRRIRTKHIAIAAGVLLPVFGVVGVMAGYQKVRESAARSAPGRGGSEVMTFDDAPQTAAAPPVVRGDYDALPNLSDLPAADPNLNKVLQRAANPGTPWPDAKGAQKSERAGQSPVPGDPAVSAGQIDVTTITGLPPAEVQKAVDDLRRRSPMPAKPSGPHGFSPPGAAPIPQAGQGFGGGFAGGLGGAPGGGSFGGFGGGGFGGNPTATGTPLSAGQAVVPSEVALPALRLADGEQPGRYGNSFPPRPGNDRFPATVENAFTPVEGQNALSTFGVDVDTASYSIIRNYLGRGMLPPADAVRLEEVVNYFPYQDKPPTGDDPFAVTVEVADCPWQAGHRLARIGLKAKPVAAEKRPPSNLVFLIDVSGSMNQPNKLPLVKASLKLLVGQLGENDRVAMVVYAGNSGLVLNSTSASNKNLIVEALDRLEAGGSTNGAGGLQQAYDVAVANFIPGGTNRVVLCTDGDWNVGTTDTNALVRMIEDKRKTGVFLSVFGFGMGNLRDEMMVKLAGKGNGNYGYIDTLREAHKALVEQLGGTLVAVAKDVKIQVEFNPAAVKAYRLLGYEKRALAAKDFADDTKDAGEMGAGHVVTALYELVPAGGSAAPAAGEGLRYQPNPDPKPVAAAPPAKEAFLVKMRHKKPDGDVSVLRELPVANAAVPLREASEDLRFSAAAAAFALVLRESPYKGTATFGTVLELAEGATRFDPSGYRAEFVELVRKAQGLPGRR